MIFSKSWKENPPPPLSLLQLESGENNFTKSLKFFAFIKIASCRILYRCFSKNLSTF